MNSKASKSRPEVITSQQPLSAVNFHDLFHELPQPYLLLATNDPLFTIIDMNRARERAMGVSRRHTRGKPLFEAYPEDAAGNRTVGVAAVTAKVRAAIATGKVQFLERVRFDTHQPDGSYRERYWSSTYQPLMNPDGSVAYILATARDITEEVETERQLEATEARLNAAMSIGRVGSWVWEAERGIVVADSTFARMLGLDPRKARAGVAPERVSGAVHPEDRERVMGAIRRSVEKHTGVDVEFRVLSNEGIVKWVLMRGRAHYGKNGEPVAFPGVTVDITERHDLESQVKAARLRHELSQQEALILQKRNQELEAISRTKDEFVALASHQLRTPATAVKQYVGMVLQGYAGELSELQLDMLEKAFESNERQIKIINQILNAARVDTGRLMVSLGPTDLQRLLTGICEEMHSSIEQHGQKLVTQIGSSPVQVRADSGYLRMAIENIIHNASVYTPEGGTITVQLKRMAKEARINITDTGVGIRASDIPKLFVKFSRIHNPLSVQAGGSGIGLYLSAEIMRLHGGRITVQSKLHKGTTFSIMLPLVKSSNRGAKQKTVK